MDGLLDTSVVIEIFGGNRRVVDGLYQEGNKEYSLPTVVLFELHCGHLKEREELMLEMIPKVEFDENSAKIAGAIFRDMMKKGKRPPLNDLLIASTAIAHNATLYTCDRDFERFKEYGLKVKVLKR
ncbi:type II toxin-antitoxin system VapC family toxin [Thermococcus aggregans]|uniref:Type II toxin-antitoxin system VapC family toxin n=1 Tax=Thermococcus aggregans TaxID=110163 RepID=A0A9E7MWS4_THEAG|nr:type II toxin-antitoxin system VapC family toxin [Thermococcus aggregans]USS40237.1 type II toxin-antitoxin system VapC family toxin [Thermococcus aggregans]